MLWGAGYGGDSVWRMSRDILRGVVGYCGLIGPVMSHGRGVWWVHLSDINIYYNNCIILYDSNAANMDMFQKLHRKKENP